MATQFKYLRPEDVQKLGAFEFAPKTLVEGYLSGRRRAVSRGVSTEFRDYRPYSEGDDPKLVDWKVYARTDRHYLRTFVHETNMDCHIFLDSSASMGFGNGATKLDYASFFAAALSYLVIRHNDRVSLQLFDSAIRQFVPAGGTRKHLHHLLNLLEENHPGEETSLGESLRRAFPLLRQRGSLIVISDFFDDVGDIFGALSLYLHRGFQVHLFHVLTPEELDLPDAGLRAFVDLESGDRMIAHTTDLRRDYQGAMQEHIGALRETAARRRIDYCLARTDTHYFELFDHLMR